MDRTNLEYQLTKRFDAFGRSTVKLWVMHHDLTTFPTHWMPMRFSPAYVDRVRHVLEWLRLD